jgi:hypothetical protein
MEVGGDHCAEKRKPASLQSSVMDCAPGIGSQHVAQIPKDLQLAKSIRAIPSIVTKPPFRLAPVRKDCFRRSRLVRLLLESVTGFAFEVQHKLEFWASHDEDSISYGESKVSFAAAGIEAQGDVVAGCGWAACCAYYAWAAV